MLPSEARSCGWACELAGGLGGTTPAHMCLTCLYPGRVPQVAQKDHLVESYVKNKEAQDRETYTKARWTRPGRWLPSVLPTSWAGDGAAAHGRSGPGPRRGGNRRCRAGLGTLWQAWYAVISPHCCTHAQVAALLNSKKAKLRELQQQVDELQVRQSRLACCAALACLLPAS